MKAVVYTKENCQWCERVKYLLSHLNFDYIEYKYETDFTKEQFYAEFGDGATFPQVSINDQYIGGCKDTLQYLQEQKML